MELKRNVCQITLLTVALFGLPLPALAQQPAATQEATETNLILQRLQQLEAQVQQYQAETLRLREELQELQAGKRTVEQVQSGAGSAVSHTSESAVDPGSAPTVTAQPAEDEWAEPEVIESTEGRDEEARRRVTELETQLRKMQAQAAKEDQEKAGKVQFDFSGKYKVRLNSRDNFNLNNPAQQWAFDNKVFFDHRFQLQIDASYEESSLRLLLDKGNFVADWKEDGEGTLERWGDLSTVNAALVRELFYQYTTSNVLLRLGRQNWDEGHGMVLQGPTDALRLQLPLGKWPWGQATLTAGYIAPFGAWRSFDTFLASGGPPAGNHEEVFSTRSELDVYYLDFEVRPARGLRLKPFLIKTTDRGALGDADLNLDKDFDATTLPRDGGFNPIWYGIVAAAEFDNWRFETEMISLNGDFAQSRDIDAHALYFRSETDLGDSKSLRKRSLGLELGMGSGNRISDSAIGTVRDFSGLSLCRDRHKYGEIYSEDIRAGYFLWESNLANITYFRLDTQLVFNNRLVVTPSFTRIWTTEDVFEGRGPIGDWSVGNATSTRTTNDVGWEVDLSLRYPLKKRVEGFLSFGYFNPGAVYARFDGSEADPAIELIIGAELVF